MPNAAKSAYWLGRAVAAGYRPALYFNEHLLLKPLVTAAEATGNPTTEYQLALAYYRGRYDGQTIPIRPGKTFYWFHRCAESGNAAAEFSVGYCYQFGFGTAINYQHAAHWYTLSAKQHNSAAENNIGMMHQRGEFYPKSDTKAAVWFLLSSSQGDAMAKKNFQGLLQSDIVQSPHPTQFIGRMQRAIRQYNPDSDANLMIAGGLYQQILEQQLKAAKADHDQWVLQQQQEQQEEEQQQAEQAQEDAQQQQQDDADGQDAGDQPDEAAPEPEPDPGE